MPEIADAQPHQLDGFSRNGKHVCFALQQTDGRWGCYLGRRGYVEAGSRMDAEAMLRQWGAVTIRENGAR